MPFPYKISLYINNEYLAQNPRLVTSKNLSYNLPRYNETKEEAIDLIVRELQPITQRYPETCFLILIIYNSTRSLCSIEVDVCSIEDGVLVIQNTLQQDNCNVELDVKDDTFFKIRSV